MTHFSLRSTTTAVQHPTKSVDLSDRELEVLRLICQQKTSKEIAEKLFISYRTVEGHRRRIQEKVGARNIVGLVLYAVKHHLV